MKKKGSRRGTAKSYANSRHSSRYSTRQVARSPHIRDMSRTLYRPPEPYLSPYEEYRDTPRRDLRARAKPKLAFATTRDKLFAQNARISDLADPCAKKEQNDTTRRNIIIKTGFGGRNRAINYARRRYCK